MNFPLSKVKLSQLDKKLVFSALNSERLGRGKYGEEFEANFAKWIGVKYSASVSNGSAALHIALLLENIKKGDEVITTPFSYIASSNAIRYLGAIPKFVDINDKTFCIDENLIKKNISKKTKAILPVHIFGFSANIDAINEIAKEYGLKVIEDACQAHGAEYRNKRVGTFNNTTTFSFYSNKIVTCGEGGMVVTSNKSKIKIAKLLRDHGRRKPHGELIHDIIGYNYGLDELSSALGVGQMKTIDKVLSRREKLSKHYDSLLQGIDGIQIPYRNPNFKRSWFVYYIKVSSLRIRTIIKNVLKKENIGTKYYYPSIHLQPCYSKDYNYRKGMFPVSENASDTILALPMYNSLTLLDVEYICDHIKNTIKNI